MPDEHEFGWAVVVTGEGLQLEGTRGSAEKRNWEDTQVELDDDETLYHDL